MIIMTDNRFDNTNDLVLIEVAILWDRNNEAGENTKMWQGKPQKCTKQQQQLK